MTGGEGGGADPVRDGIRLLAALAQCEMALVRRDAVAVPLLAQAARHAAGLPAGDLVAAAAHLVRTVDVNGSTDGERSARKTAQALCRCALQRTEAAILAASGTS